ncbi:MAG: PH domain-containing protein [Candidatus Kuenenia sp.]|nr:PH domain-containing protein [Candidatus Kuenenia hertensis]
MKITVCNSSFFFTDTTLRSVLKPRITHYWLLFFIFVFSVFLSLRKYGIESVFGLFLLSFGSILFCYALLTICVSKYLITQDGLFLRQGPFSASFKKIDFNDINKISIHQGSIQKRLRVGTLKIYTNTLTYSLKGIKNPHQIRELINQEKVSYNERRALLKNIL